MHHVLQEDLRLKMLRRERSVHARTSGALLTQRMMLYIDTVHHIV